ncbi:hypothetical protein KR215_005344 [Drosophila sulfurigaster]|nr:hypothetical protein KR215_005344 [Drosophila sulfurigaster]
MSKLPRSVLFVLLSLLLLHWGTIVDATCGHCYGSHACIDNNTAQICFDGTPNASYTIKCPDDTPICTQYGQMCVSTDLGLTPACGDTSNCDQCSDGQTYACTTRTTFGLCSNGTVVNPQRITCPSGYFCSVSGAASGEPCAAGCEAADVDVCDRETDSNSTDTSTTTTTTAPTTGSTTLSTADDSTDSTTESSTSSSTSSTATPTDATAFCQTNQKAGRFAIPNDTVCTSFITCSYKASAWVGAITNCQAAKPYFHATDACGTVQPTQPGCL